MAPVRRGCPGVPATPPGPPRPAVVLAVRCTELRQEDAAALLESARRRRRSGNGRCSKRRSGWLSREATSGPGLSMQASCSRVGRASPPPPGNRSCPAQRSGRHRPAPRAWLPGQSQVEARVARGAAVEGGLLGYQAVGPVVGGDISGEPPGLRSRAPVRRFPRASRGVPPYRSCAVAPGDGGVVARARCSVAARADCQGRASRVPRTRSVALPTPMRAASWPRGPLSGRWPGPSWALIPLSDTPRGRGPRSRSL